MSTGFVLEPTYRIDRGRAVVHVWGVLDSGRPFLVRDARTRPAFYVRAADAPRLPSLGLPEPLPTALRTMAGEPVARVEAALPADVPALRARLEAAGIPVLEADVRFAMRWLMDRGVRGALRIEGPSREGARGVLVFDDPEVSAATWAPTLRALSLDIETLPDASRVLSVALHGPGTARVLLVTPPGAPRLPPDALGVADERALLAALEDEVRAHDPDVITGWNVVGFDLAVLARRAEELGRPLRLGRGDEPLRVRTERSPWGSSRADVEGRVVLDGSDLLRGAFVRMEDWRLETVARAILGEGKLLHGAGRAEEIERLWREDVGRFSAYNLRDAELVTRILERTGVLGLAVRRSLLAGMPLDRISGSIASFDSLYLPELHRRGFVAPSVEGADAGAPGDATAGGAVLDPVPGLHARVLVLDFKSLYPSLMRTFNVDPLAHRPAPGPGEDVIRTPSGAAFSREPGILPAILERLMAAREEAKRAGDATASQATKILMNSFYGVLAAPACRFHSSALANAITGTGQAVLRWTKARVEEAGLAVLYGDTDSVFVASGAPTDAAAREAGAALVSRLNEDLARHLEREYGVASRLEIELEAVYLRLLLPRERHGPGGARKRYAGLVEEADGRREVVFVGMESVRRDSSRAARAFQKGLLERVFADEPVAGWVRAFVEEVRAGRHDEDLVLRKALRKDVDAYTATTPPHVRAARLGGASGRIVEYVMTTAGAEPAGSPAHPIDREHYVEKELRPIAEAVLPLLGLEWDEVVGNPRQLRLF